MRLHACLIPIKSEFRVETLSSMACRVRCHITATDSGAICNTCPGALNGAIWPHTDEPVSFLLCPGTDVCLLHYVTAHITRCSLCSGSLGLASRAVTSRTSKPIVCVCSCSQWESFDLSRNPTSKIIFHVIFWLFRLQSSQSAAGSLNQALEHTSQTFPQLHFCIIWQTLRKVTLMNMSESVPLLNPNPFAIKSA